VDTVSGGITPIYAGNDSGIYKSVAGITYQYAGAPNAWTRIGLASASALYPAAGTVFVRSGANTLRYRGTPGQFIALGNGLGKIVGTTSAAYAINASGNVVRLDSPDIRTPVRSSGDAREIVAGGAHIFVLTATGPVLRLEDDGMWTDISCSGEPSEAGCADGCEPGPTPTRVAPAYTDTAVAIQNAARNVQYDVLTQHNDIARTGAAVHEDILTPAAVAGGAFGYLGSVAVTGRIYGQPLYVENAAVICNGQPLRNANMAYVATLENIVYAIDVDQRKVCWSTAQLACPQKAWATDIAGDCQNAAEDGACNGNLNMPDGGIPREVGVRVGIVSTPVIDLAKSVMYVVARHRAGSDARGRFFVHAIDTRTGQLVAKVEAVADTLNGRDDCNGKPFHPSLSTQRAGLLLVNDKLFVAFAGNAGESSAVNYFGHVLGFDVSNPANPTNLAKSFCATPESDGPSRWTGNRARRGNLDGGRWACFRRDERLLHNRQWRLRLRRWLIRRFENPGATQSRQLAEQFRQA
jgi:hypothetical protein